MGRSPGAVVLLGKELRLRPERALRELRSRAAAAALLHHRFGIPVLAVEGRLRGSSEAGSEIARRFLGEQHVPERAIITRSTSHTTLVEVWTVRACLRAMRVSSAIAITSHYHVARARRYFDARQRGDDVVVDVLAPESVAARFASSVSHPPAPLNAIDQAVATIEASRLAASELQEEQREEFWLQAGSRLLDLDFPRFGGRSSAFGPFGQFSGSWNSGFEVCGGEERRGGPRERCASASNRRRRLVNVAVLRA